jgi:hypothetical protein
MNYLCNALPSVLGGAHEVEAVAFVVRINRHAVERDHLDRNLVLREAED